MELQVIGGEFSVCKLSSLEGVRLTDPFTFLTVTDEELSWVGRTENRPHNLLAAEHGWRALRVAGTLDFAMVGVLAELSAILAQGDVSLFAVSTYNTDYLLTKADHFDRALELLTAHGHTVV